MECETLHFRSARQSVADAIEWNVVQSQWSDKMQTNEEHVTMDGVAGAV